MRKTVIITGGSGGIGSACARAFHKKEYNVVVGYSRSEDKAKALIGEINLNGGSAIAVKADLTKLTGAEELFAAAKKRYGRVDVLVNCCGVSARKLLVDQSEEEIRFVTDVNLLSTIFCTKIAVGEMLGRGGSIVNISSMWGICGASMEAVYSAAKAGVIGFTKAMAKEYSPMNIRVNCVAPGSTDTEMMKEFSESDMRLIEEDIPLGRMASADEIADSVVFIGEHTYITGVTLNVSGGAVV